MLGMTRNASCKTLLKKVFAIKCAMHLILAEKAIPTEIRHDARALQHEMKYDVVKSDEKQIIDDEYATVGMQDPKVCVTTSRDPSSRLKQFSKYDNVVYSLLYVTSPGKLNCAYQMPSRSIAETTASTS